MIAPHCPGSGGCGGTVAGWHSPSYALLRVVKQHAHDVKQAGEQLQGEVEESDPQTCSGGGTAWAWPHGYRGEGTAAWGAAWGTLCTAIPREPMGSMPPHTTAPEKLYLSSQQWRLSRGAASSPALHYYSDYKQGINHISIKNFPEGTPLCPAPLNKATGCKEGREHTLLN